MKKLTLTIALALVAGFSALTVVQSAEIPTRGPIPFAAFDSDASGAISEQEFLQGHAARVSPWAPVFSDFDTNHDAQLSPAELSAGQRARRQARTGMQRPGLEPGQPRGAGMGRNMPKFTEFDLNQDGVLTEDEFIEARGKRISERAKQGYLMRGLKNARPYSDIDSDGNGAVTPQEFAAAQALHRQQRQN